MGSLIQNVDADARLICAAPELLTALIDAVELLEVISPIEGDVLRKARAAIEKANGDAYEYISPLGHDGNYKRRDE